MTFDVCIGIDYSGAKTPVARNAALQVYAAPLGSSPQRVPSPASTYKSHRNWCRRDIAEWLIEKSRADQTFVAGLDHGFSFPHSYFQRYKLRTWSDFLEDFCRYWPTAGDDIEVETIRQQQGKPPTRTGSRQKPVRTGSSQEYRLTERWSSSAKSVFQFDVQGSVAKSTHAGIPWLQRIREEVGDRLHFWPFDGWQPQRGKSVIAEVYPSILRNRYPRAGRSCDQQDAYSVARWLCELSQRGCLDRYFDPPLTDHERKIADLEGWILGIT